MRQRNSELAWLHIHIVWVPSALLPSITAFISLWVDSYSRWGALSLSANFSIHYSFYQPITQHTSNTCNQISTVARALQALFSSQ